MKIILVCGARPNFMESRNLIEETTKILNGDVKESNSQLPFWEGRTAERITKTLSRIKEIGVIHY